MTRPIQIPTEEIIEALVDTKGNLSESAKRLGCSRRILYDRIAAEPKLRQVKEQERQKLLDLAENRLAEAIDRGEPFALCFYLKTQGKDRGYVEKSVLEILQPATLENMTEAELLRVEQGADPRQVLAERSGQRALPAAEPSDLPDAPGPGDLIPGDVPNEPAPYQIELQQQGEILEGELVGD